MSQKQLLLLSAGQIGEQVGKMLAAQGVSLDLVALETWRHWDEHGFAEALARSQASVAAAVLERPHPTLMQQYNAAAYRAGLPWTLGLIDMTLIQIGPTVMPGETACYTCFHKRFFTNSGLSRIDLETSAFYDRNPFAKPGGRLPLLEAYAAGLFALEIGRLVRGATVMTKGRYWYIDPLRHTQGSHHIVPTPWCNLCGSVAEPEAWSYETLTHTLAERLPFWEKSDV